MKALKFLIVLFFLIQAASCDMKKKKYPEPVVVTNAAVYYSKLTINNTPIILEAGVDDYYMYSSITKDSSGVLYQFKANLAKSNCQDCPKSLKIQINDYKAITSANSPVIDSSLRVDRYPLLAGNPEPTYSVKFSSLNAASSYTWEFGDGTRSYLANPPAKVYPRAGTYNVCLTTRSAQNCVSTICNTEKINNSPFSCKTAIKIVNMGADSVSFSQVTSGQAPFDWYWSFGDGTYSTLAEPSHNYAFKGSYPVSLKVTDNKGDVAIANYNLKTQNDLSSCTANYSYTPIQQSPAALPLSQVIIKWVDSDGTIYTSNSSAQPSDGFFEVLSVMEGDRNEIQQPTKKLSVRFKCKLYNGSKTISIDHAEAIICVAYK